MLPTEKPTFYTYKSDRTGERKIPIPSRFMNKGEALVKLALSCLDVREFGEKRGGKNSYLEKVYVPESALSLIMNKSGTHRLQDQVFFETCMHLIEDELVVMDGELTEGHEYRARERYDAVRLHQSLRKALETL